MVLGLDIPPTLLARADEVNSGHESHKEQPQLVIDAIREVVEAVRNRPRGVSSCVS